MNKGYQAFEQKMQKIADINYAMSVLQWDKEVNLPTKGARFRTQQISTLAGIAHDLQTESALEEMLNELKNQNDLSPEQAKNIALVQDKFARTKKLSTEFVVRQSKAISKSYHAWLKAREANDYRLFKDAFSTIVDIKKEEAELVGYEDHPYDALMDQFEKGAKTKDITALFKDVRSQLVDFVKRLSDRPQVEGGFLKQFYPKDKQWDYGLEILKSIGYDFEAGRQDISPHPFTTNFSSEDVRVTTRIDENDFSNMLWSCIHEGGHALYEQGLPSNQYGMPLGEYISLGIHESQSRLWENNVGRSLPFWKAHYKGAQQTFPENLGNIDLMTFYKGINRVAPNLIRTESDELHYHFHVLIRFEIEKGLIEGSLDVSNLDEIWRSKYKEYLNVEVPDDKRGILQDIHWSYGSIGYFPTYSLGSFYAAQFFAQACKEIPDLILQIEKGNTQPILDWLRSNIHQHGKRYTAEELCVKITGEPLNFKYFMDYAQEKYNGIYQ